MSARDDRDISLQCVRHTQSVFALVLVLLIYHFVLSHRIRPPEPAPILDSPTLSYDQSALALSFLPSLRTSSSYQNYLKYRHDLYLSSLDFYQRHIEHNIKAGSQNFTLPPPSPRYVLPSSHISIARFVEEIPKEKVKDLANGLQKISKEAEEQFKELNEVMRDENQLCIGRNWYGGGKVLKP